MKSILVLASILITSSAMATPVVGDMVRYNMTNSGQVFEQKIEVTAIDANNGTFTTNISVIFNGTTVESHSETNDLNAAAESESTLDHCSEMPADIASLETITVPAGTFKVCHIHSEANGMKIDQYMGKVLFGLVKSVTSLADGSAMSVFELIEVKKN